MIIRKATLNESESIANLMLLAMEEIVYVFICESNPDKAKAFLKKFIEQPHNQYSYQNCWVAEEESEILAVANVYDGARLKELRQPVLQHLQQNYPQSPLPEDETAAGEYYIDTLAVAPAQQGRGIGTKMLNFLTEAYVVKKESPLGLLVEEQNPEAEKLYLKLGFKEVGRKTLAGKKMKHLQKESGDKSQETRLKIV